MIKAYRKKFAVDRLKAVAELQKLGKTFTKAEIDKENQAVENYRRQQKQKKIKKRQKKQMDKYHDLLIEQDGMFCYIAGYTSGDAPYGVTWEEVGIDSNLLFDIKVKLYKDMLI